LGSLVADSLALGAHWVYDTNLIVTKAGRVTELLAPTLASYHPTKQAGDLTHYGDQTVWLLDSLNSSPHHKYSLQTWCDVWKANYESYSGYRDHASKKTYSNWQEGKTAETGSSDSTELSAVGRIGPLVYRYRNENVEEYVKACESQAALTHNTPLVLSITRFFAKVIRQVVDGHSPIEAIKNLSHETPQQIKDQIELGIASASQDSLSTIKKFGQSCSATAGLPGVIHLIVKYENDLESALIENVMAGGDSASRGLLVGLVLSAHLGENSIPKRWIDNLKVRNYVEESIKKFDFKPKL